jgi:DnaJ-class molecular chaperone
MNYLKFGVIDDEAELRMDDLRALDEAHAKGVLYPPCPRCRGDYQIEVVIQIDGEQIETEYITCPTCSGTGEAEMEKAERWVLDRLDEYEVSDEDEDYLKQREKIS